MLLSYDRLKKHPEESNGLLVKRTVLMANPKLKRKENAEGQFFVDSSCIDCGTCYWVASETFRRDEGQSAVFQQPAQVLENEMAYRALYSCPTNSIGVQVRADLAQEVARGFPYEIADGVFHSGFHSEKSFGATSYFIKREKGNVLVDSPRFLNKLVKRFEELGGVKLQLLTHKDDIADTDKYWQVFRGRRVIHIEDSSESTSHYEEFLRGEDEIVIDEDLIAIPVPGHTKGSVCFLYKDKFLFTGDHLAFSNDLEHLYAFKRACWYDFSIQIESMKKLLDYGFESILPGHGAPLMATEKEVKRSLEKCLYWMQN